MRLSVLSTAALAAAALLLAVDAQAGRGLTGLDVAAVVGGGPPFNMGGGFAVDARPWRRLQFELAAFAGPSIGAQPQGKLGLPITIAPSFFARINFATWQASVRPFVCLQATANGCLGVEDQPIPLTHALSLELGVLAGALPFRWGTVNETAYTKHFAERAVEFRYVLYPAFGLRWDLYDEGDNLTRDRGTLGLRVYHGPVGAPGAPGAGESLTWGPPAEYEFSPYEGRSWGAAGLASIVLFRYLATEVELGGGALPSALPLWLQVWFGASIPVL